MFRNWREFIGRMVKRLRPHTPCDVDNNRETADELAQADADYAAGKLAARTSANATAPGVAIMSPAQWAEGQSRHGAPRSGWISEVLDRVVAAGDASAWTTKLPLPRSPCTLTRRASTSSSTNSSPTRQWMASETSSMYLRHSDISAPPGWMGAWLLGG
jgi:hypothetical protein